ncbi:myelin-associated glycoprotein-like [Sardina pilchardus]|uniref:myelin-associated glycoprotein-like n=1 Tax=Sardina pilchardus TaxID=27697 RepID=UPI002E160C47
MIFFKTLFVFNLLLLAIGKDTFFVSPPHKIHAFTGSCILIPCAFNISDFESKLTTFGSIYAMWIKGGTQFGRGEYPVVFSGTTNTTRLLERIEITGNLHQKNCTTVFYNVNKTHADKYFFRIEMNSFKVTFKEPFNLTVEDTPLNPRVSELSEVSEGTSVTLTCTAAAPCPSQPPTITWSPPTGNTHTHIQDEENGNRSLMSVLTFTASHSQNGRNISCSASYLRHKKSLLQRISIVQTIRVLFSPADAVASVSPSGPAAEGSSVTLTCNSSEANPPVQNYTWFRKDQDTPIGSGQTLTFNLSSSDEGLYYCRAEHPQGGKESAAVTLEIKASGHFPLPLVVGGSVGGPLLCVLIWLALRWQKSHQEIKPGGHRQSCDPDDQGRSIHVRVPQPPADPDEADYENMDDADYEDPDEADYEDPDEADYGDPDEADYEDPDEADYGDPDEADYEDPDQADYEDPDQADYEKIDEADYEDPDEADYENIDEADYENIDEADYEDPDEADYENIDEVDYEDPHGRR